MLKAVRWVILAGLVLPPSVSAAQQAGEGTGVCRAIRAAIEDDLKAIAMDTVAVEHEDSAPRAQVHATTWAAAQVRIQTNVQLMVLNRCDPIAGPVDPNVYRIAAENCWRMRVKVRQYGFGGPTSAEASASCYQPDWRRDREAAGLR